ncbi:MAG: transposase [Leptolyngbya sp. RL_3_1]|nr:transposase [Leptolyngbya sp. RL_3_1]
MWYNPDQYHRRSIRLKGYDYGASGLYFITLCCHQRQNLFGDIVDGEMTLNDQGKTVADEWMKTPHIRPTFELDAWVIMPNHIHGIIHISGVEKLHSGERAHRRAPLRCQSAAAKNNGIADRRPRSLSSFVAGFKSATTKAINMTRKAPGTPVWQRNYYDHIIRDAASLQRIRQYIQNNPATWPSDQLNPAQLNPAQLNPAQSAPSQLG